MATHRPRRRGVPRADDNKRTTNFTASQYIMHTELLYELIQARFSTRKPHRGDCVRRSF